MGLDTNGIWQYTEADSQVSMSALLNLLAASVATQVGAWTGYVPVLTAPTTNPTNYSAVGRYRKIGKTVIAQFQVQGGVSPAFTPGVGGAYNLSIPVAASGALAVTAGNARLYDSSSGNAILAARCATTGSLTMGFQTTATYAGALGNVAPTFPWTWAAGDIMDGFIVYEAA